VEICSPNPLIKRFRRVTKIIKHPSLSIDLKLKGGKITTFFTVLLNHPDARLGHCANKTCPGSLGAAGITDLSARLGKVQWSRAGGLGSWGWCGVLGWQWAAWGGRDVPGQQRQGCHQTGCHPSSSEQKGSGKMSSVKQWESGGRGNTGLLYTDGSRKHVGSWMQQGGLGRLGCGA